MNWGKWIFVSFVLFAVFIATLVTVCVKQDVSLVAKDYYKEELAYQRQIERMNNAAALTTRPEISIVDEKFIMVRFDKFSQVKEGELVFFCPSNAGLDRRFSLHHGEEDFQVFPLDQAPRGMYRARMSWMMNDKEFYIEQVIHI